MIPSNLRDKVKETLERSQRRSSSTSAELERLSPLGRHLQNGVDLGIAALIVVAPLFMGGRSPLGKLVFVGLVGLVAALWFACRSCCEKSSWRWSGLEWVFLAGFGILAIQLASLPGNWLNRLSPSIAQLIPMVTQGEASVFGVDA